MAVIHVPRPQKSARDPHRPVNSLLRSQLDHLQSTERRLPVKYRTDIYVNAIATEGEAARYIREVTEAIHAAHEDADRKRRAPKKKTGIKIAAAAAPARRKSASKTKSKPSSAKRGRKKK